MMGFLVLPETSVEFKLHRIGTLVWEIQTETSDEENPCKGSVLTINASSGEELERQSWLTWCCGGKTLGAQDAGIPVLLEGGISAKIHCTINSTMIRYEPR